MNPESMPRGGNLELGGDVVTYAEEPEAEVGSGEERCDGHEEEDEPAAGASTSGIPPSYDEVFPALPESDLQAPQSSPDAFRQTLINQRMKVRSSNVTYVFSVPLAERKYRDQEQFGEHAGQARVCQEIMQKTGTQIEMSSSKDGTLTCLITGKEEQVKAAKTLISTELQTQASYLIPVPKEYHKFVLGKSGKKLSDLEAATGTKIIVPRQGDPSDQIKVVGSRFNIEKAVHEIQLISQEAASRSFERITIPKEYHMFVIGPHGKTVDDIMSETRAKVNIPSVMTQRDDISIAGERDSVLKAKDRILAIYEEKKRNCQTVSMEVKKSQHKYIIGMRGQTLQDIFDETGASVVVPSSESPNETITLLGEQDKLARALSVLYEKAHSETECYIKAEQWVQKHILGPKGSRFQELSKSHDFDRNIQITFDSNEDQIRIRGKREEAERVKAALEAAVRQTKKEMTVEELRVHPKYHRFIIGKSGMNIRQIREETGAQIHVPSETDTGESSNIILVDGSPEAVKKAVALLNDQIAKLVERENEVTKELIIHQRFHRQIIGTKGDNIREIRDRFNQVMITFPDPNTKSDKVSIRGAKEDVEKCYKHLAQCNKELLVNNYRDEVPIFKQFHKYIIGKDGSTIRKIRDDYNTKIDLPEEGSTSDVIVITGRKENVEKAKAKIQEIQNECANVVQQDIMIPAKFHTALIGSKGRLVRQIKEDCGGVLIRFPNEGSGSDKVSIRGPKDCVTKAKQQLLELTNEKKINDFSIELKANPELHRFLIGKNGSNIAKVRERTGARILFPTEKEEKAEDADKIVVIGKKENVLKAKEELMEMIKKLEETIEATILVAPKHHRHFFLKKGAVLRQITDEIGKFVSISFPKTTQKESEIVTLKGAKEFVELAKNRIHEIVADLEAQVSIECPIEQQHHRIIMGMKGANVQKIQEMFNVHIKFPERNLNGLEGEGDPKGINGDVRGDEIVNGEAKSPRPRKCDIITIRGRIENCEKAKDALIASIPVTLKVEVPFDYHRFIIGQKGREVRDLMDNYEVSITVPPPSEQSDEVVIKGLKDNAMNAKEAVLERVRKLDEEKQDRELRSFKEEIHVDPQYHSKIIGRKGAVISKIRSKFDILIQFPERGEQGTDLITLSGYEKNVKEAKEEIMKIVRSLEDMVSETIPVDSRIHPRLIGSKGKNIRKIMETFKVDIRIPKSTDANLNQVIISGNDEDVQDCKDHILNLVEEYMDDVAEQYKPPPRQSEVNESRSGESHGSGFMVKGGPWEQQQIMPDTNSREQFPSMAGEETGGAVGGGGGDSIDTGGSLAEAPKQRWGPKAIPNIR